MHGTPVSSKKVNTVCVFAFSVSHIHILFILHHPKTTMILNSPTDNCSCYSDEELLVLLRHLKDFALSSMTTTVCTSTHQELLTCCESGTATDRKIGGMFYFK